MPKPLVSVVIPAYNEERYIGTCLKSVVNQDFPKNKYEIIVVDNDSTDETPRIVKKHSPKAKLVSEGRRGVVFARIKGVEESRGEIIAFTDADAIVPHDWLTKIVSAYRTETVAAVGGSNCFSPTNHWIKLYETVINHFNATFGTFPGHNMSIRRKAYLLCGGFSPKVNLAEDFYLSWNARKVGQSITLDNNIVLVSSRRFLKGFFAYCLKYFFNTLTIIMFNRSVFFHFQAVRGAKRHSWAVLKERVKY